MHLDTVQWRSTDYNSAVHLLAASDRCRSQAYPHKRKRASHWHLDEDAMGGRHSSAHHDGSGGRQPEGARAGNHQHRDAEQQRKEEVVVACRQPLRGVQPMHACHIPAT